RAGCRFWSRSSAATSSRSSTSSIGSRPAPPAPSSLSTRMRASAARARRSAISRPPMCRPVSPSIRIAPPMAACGYIRARTSSARRSWPARARCSIKAWRMRGSPRPASIPGSSSTSISSPATSRSGTSTPSTAPAPTRRKPTAASISTAMSRPPIATAANGRSATASRYPWASRCWCITRICTSARARITSRTERFAGRQLECDLVFEAPAHRALLGGPGQAEKISGLVSELAVRRQAVDAGEHRAQAMLLIGELPGRCDVVDFAEQLDAGFEPRIKAQPRLPGEEERRVIGAVRPDLLGEHQIERVHGVDAVDIRQLFLDERTEAERIGAAARRGVLVLGEASEIRPVFSLRRQLPGAFERARGVAQILPWRRRRLRLDAETQERRDAEFELVGVALVVALAAVRLVERRVAVVLELHLAILDGGIAPLELGMRRRRAEAQAGRKPARGDPCQCAHEARCQRGARLKPIEPASLELPERRRVLWDGEAVHVQGHRHQAVIAHGADEIDHRLLAEALGHRLERRVAHLLGLEQLLGEIIDRLLVGLEPGGPLPGGDVGGECRLQAGMEREAVMCVPLVLRRPVA